MTISDDNGAKKLLNEMRDGRGSFSKVFTGFLSVTTSQKSLLLHFPKLSVGPDQKTEDKNFTKTQLKEHRWIQSKQNV